MFSQNVVEPREFITEPGIWDSQQNSQVWGNSQTSASQYRSSGDLQYRPWKASSGSDYWSQSQNQSQQLQENDDGSKYHLRYLNKPPIFSSKDDSKCNEEKGHVKTLQQYVEIQRKKSFEQETRAKLDHIVKMLNEYSEEVQASIGDLKSELGSEISKSSEKWHSTAVQITKNLNKVAEEVKGNFEVLQKSSNDEKEKSKEEFQQLTQQLQALQNQSQNILAQLVSIKENKDEEHNLRNESLLQEILSYVARKPADTKEASIQTCTVPKRDESTQYYRLETLVKETQTDDQQYELQFKDGDSFESRQNSCMQKHVHYTLQCRSPKSSMNFSNANSLTNARCDQPTTQLQHCQIRRPMVTLQHQRAQPLSNLLPSERVICFSEVNSSSPVAAVSPIINRVTIKQENTPSNGVKPKLNDYGFVAVSINNNIIRRPKRRNQTEKKDDHSEIFMFDFCSDLHDSQDMLQVENPKETQRTNEACQAKVKKTSVHTAPNEQIKENIRCDWPSEKARNTAVQKDITSYGKIKKHSVGNWAKKTPWRSPHDSMNVSKITPKNKVNTRLTSRESIAQKRKEYAESVFCFDDYADLKQIQLQFKPSSNQNLHSR